MKNTSTTDLYTNVLSSVTQQLKWKPSSLPADEWWRKWCTSHSGILLSCKKEWRADTVTNKRMDLENIMLSERCQTQKVTYYIILFISSVQNRQIQRERWVLVTRDWREWGGKELVRAMEFLSGRWKSSKITRGSLHTSVSILRTTKLYTLKWWILWHTNYIPINLLLNNVTCGRAKEKSELLHSSTLGKTQWVPQWFLTSPFTHAHWTVTISNNRNKNLCPWVLRHTPAHTLWTWHNSCSPVCFLRVQESKRIDRTETKALGQQKSRPFTGFIVAQTWKQPRRPARGEWETVVRPEDGNYLELKMSHQAMKTQRNLTRRLQRKRSQSEKAAYCMISILQPSGNGKATETVSSSVVFSGCRG